MNHFYLGVDGGATKCVARLENEAGHLIAQGLGGPANIRISVEQAWASIQTAIQSISQAAGLSLPEGISRIHAGMGLAGCEIVEAYQSFIDRAPAFSRLLVTSDAHTACLGAHNGADGAVIIAGTGVVGYQIQSGGMAKVSGWGFPHDDTGSGAWLGLEAVKLTLQWHDGRLPASKLSHAVLSAFSGNFRRLVDWANQANSTQFAELAPLVIREAEAGDEAAATLLQRAAAALDAVSEALLRAQAPHTPPLHCALIGGIASQLEPRLSESTRTRLVRVQLPPEAGAILLVRNGKQT